jgi:lysine 2-monooxygenase
MPKISRRTLLASFATAAAAPSIATATGIRSLGASRPSARTRTLDVAIIGAGVSGCYAAWRLAAANPDLSIGVFERNDRIGGRLWSVTPTGMTEQVAELGGMRIANNQTPLLNLTSELGLMLDPYPATEPDDFYYLRGIRTRAKDLTCSPEFGYRPSSEFEGETPREIFDHVLKTLTGRTEWTLNSFSKARDTLSFQGSRLIDLPYEYALTQVIDSEAFRFLDDTCGYGHPNLNSCQFLEEAALDLYIKSYKHVRGGYDLVPKILAAQAIKAGVEFTMGMTFSDLRLEDDLVRIVLEQPNGPTTEILAKNAIVTIPDSAYGQLDPRSPLAGPNRMTTLRDSLLGVPATKVYASFPTQWWRKLGISTGRSITDLSMQQCFYLNDPSGRGLTLSPYASGSAAEGFWAPLLKSHPGHRITGESLVGSEIAAQLTQLHGAPVTAPTELLYRDFAGGYDGFGWNVWKPGARYATLAREGRTPFPDKRVFCCGQATAKIQGWVMDSLASVESVLRSDFQLTRPEWWPENYTI